MTIHAHLNEQGQQIFGNIFPDGLVPVLWVTAREIEIDKGKAWAYMVDWDAMTPVQRGMMIKYLAESFKAAEHTVENHILSKGLPLRVIFVSSIHIPSRFL
jgi:hypothetical protein